MYPIRLQMFRQNLENNLGAAKFVLPDVNQIVKKAVELIASPNQIFPARFFDIAKTLEAISKDNSISIDAAKEKLIADPALLFAHGIPTLAKGDKIDLISHKRSHGSAVTPPQKIEVKIKLSDDQKRRADELAGQPKARTLTQIQREISQNANYGRGNAVISKPAVLDDGMEGIRINRYVDDVPTPHDKKRKKIKPDAAQRQASSAHAPKPLEKPGAPVAKRPAQKPARAPENKASFSAKLVFDDSIRFMQKTKTVPQAESFHHFICGVHVEEIDNAFKKGAVDGWKLYTNGGRLPQTTADFLVAAKVAQKVKGIIAPVSPAQIKARIQELELAAK